jgi:AAA domain, putative AbiEii toxin, Type IV TA system
MVRAIPFIFLQRDDALELAISSKFKKAFGADLIVHRNAGSNVPLHVGERPLPAQGEDRVSLGYIERLEKLPQLQTQGDGMRSFAGVLLATSVGRETVLLIDEPEAFLHPPQAKLLGTSLIEGRRKESQIFIATHSTDIIRGVLDANSPDVKVVRIRRAGDLNRVHLLENARVRELWSDPLLRYSSILDGLFHEGVVVCEADSDCRFYSAMLEAAHTLGHPDAKRPDLMFTHCGGKARLPLVIRALHEVDVPVRAVADFDVLSAEQPLRSIVEALGHAWSNFEQDWRIVKSAVDAKRPDLNTADVKLELDRVLGAVSSTVLPENSREELQSVIRRSTAWSNAKLVGKSFVPSGDAAKACERLLTSLREAGLHVVEVGELEGFARTEGGHGPKWVNAILARNLSSDPELELARQFALKLVN